MAELFVMCPDCGLNAKLAPGEPQIKDEEGLCKHRQNPMACPDPRPHPRCHAPKKSGLAGPWRARPGSDEVKGGPGRWVTWGVGGDRDRALLRRGPKENSTASAALSRSAIILWCGAKRRQGASIVSAAWDEAADDGLNEMRDRSGCPITYD